MGRGGTAGILDDADSESSVLSLACSFTKAQCEEYSG